MAAIGLSETSRVHQLHQSVPESPCFAKIRLCVEGASMEKTIPIPIIRIYGVETMTA